MDGGGEDDATESTVSTEDKNQDIVVFCHLGSASPVFGLLLNNQDELNHICFWVRQTECFHMGI